MEMVLIVLGVLAVLFVIDRQQHEREMRLRAQRVQASHRTRAGASNDA